MTVEEFYTQNGASYKQVLSRMMGMESMVKKFLKKFLQDPTYNKLEEAVETEDWEAVFIAAHTLKGVAGNLELKNLYDTSAALTELARGKELEKIPDAFITVKEAHKACVEQIERID